MIEFMFMNDKGQKKTSLIRRGLQPFCLSIRQEFGSVFFG